MAGATHPTIHNIHELRMPRSPRNSAPYKCLDALHCLFAYGDKTYPSAGLARAISSTTSLGRLDRVSFRLSYSAPSLAFASGWVTVKARDSSSSELGRDLHH